ncbi:MAG: adenylate/guanylate cyclase domain-containing protein [Thermoguttaceae bacterium]
MSTTVNDGFRLVYQFAGQTIRREFKQPRVVIGRSMVCDLAIDSPEVARKHAEIVRDEEGWAIHDLHSHSGTAVNGIAAQQRLHHGDQITLAPTAAEPVVVTFQLLGAVRRPAQSVVLYDEPGQRSILATVDLRQFERRLGEARPGRVPGAAAAGLAAGAPAPSPVPSDPLAAVLDEPPPLPILALFKHVGEILLGSDSLDDMLQKVLSVTIDHLSGQRGVICLYDDTSGQIEPRAYRAKAAEGDRPFRVSRTILSEAIRVEQAMLVASAADDPRFRSAASVQQMGIRAAMCVPLYHAGRIRGLIYVDSRQPAGGPDRRELEVLTVLGLMVASGMVQMALRDDVARERAMRDRLARYNSPRVVEQILKQDRPREGDMLAEEYDASVLFADLAGFTALAESMGAAEVAELLNTVFEQLVAAVFAHDGTLDKYIGDAVMAIFGAPLRQEDHALRAVRTALAMHERLADCNRARPAAPALQMRIGINSGRVIAGDMGSPVHRTYTAIGDTVNVASRLEAAVAQPGQTVVGPATWELVKDHFECEPLGEVQLRGKRHSIRPYRVLRATPPREELP